MQATQFPYGDIVGLWRGQSLRGLQLNKLLLSIAMYITCILPTLSHCCCLVTSDDIFASISQPRFHFFKQTGFIYIWNNIHDFVLLAI